MTYDFHGQWEKKTGHIAPMYAHEADDDKTLNTVIYMNMTLKNYVNIKIYFLKIILFFFQNFTVHYWINKGTPRNKLIVGVPFYGQSFSLVENSGNGLGAPSYAGGEAGDETRARGFLSFYEVRATNIVSYIVCKIITFQMQKISNLFNVQNMYNIFTFTCLNDIIVI